MGFVDILRILAILAAAIFIGSWYQSEVKKARAAKAPWYKPYVSPPGIMIIVAAIGLPIVAWYLGK
jgi:hypothetical protein